MLQILFMDIICYSVSEHLHVAKQFSCNSNFRLLSALLIHCDFYAQSIILCLIWQHSLNCDYSFWEARLGNYAYYLFCTPFLKLNSVFHKNMKFEPNILHKIAILNIYPQIYNFRKICFLLFILNKSISDSNFFLFIMYINLLPKH